MCIPTVARLGSSGDVWLGAQAVVTMKVSRYRVSVLSIR